MISVYFINYLVRSLELFYKLFMIDTINRKAVPLCPFVESGNMHRAFQKFLRPDGKGIDYSHIENFNIQSVMVQRIK